MCSAAPQKTWGIWNREPRYSVSLWDGTCFCLPEEQTGWVVWDVYVVVWISPASVFSSPPKFFDSGNGVKVDDCRDHLLVALPCDNFCWSYKSEMFSFVILSPRSLPAQRVFLHAYRQRLGFPIRFIAFFVVIFVCRFCWGSCCC